LTSRFWRTVPVAAVGIAAVAACGEEDTILGRPPAVTPEAGVEASAPPDAGVDAAPADTGTGPFAAPFGLDKRPSNTTCVARPRPPSTASIALEDAFPLLPSFDLPVQMIQAPGDNTKMYVVQQGVATGAQAGAAQIRVFTNSPSVTTTSAFLAFPAGTVTVGGALEGGLLSFAFHPGWASNRTAFLSYTIGTGGFLTGSRVTRIRSTDSGATLDRATEEKTFLTVAQPFENHNGGQVAFGPDGRLYIGFGDGGSGNDPLGSGQDLDSLLGKMLRIEAGPVGPYTIPPDNPFAKGGGRPEIYAWGFRNPWRWSFDRMSGDLWVGDVGQDDWEEVDRVERGGNYGWVTKEGFHCNAIFPLPCVSAGLIDPVVEYPHTGLGESVTGGYVYQGTKIPELAGQYIFADYIQGTVYTIDWSTTPPSPKVLLSEPTIYMSSFAEDADGELYILDYLGGRVRRIVRKGAAPADTFPKLLSQTGCVDAKDATKPAPGLVPYAPTAQLWSDNAEKTRWLAIPDGSKIARAADGDFDFPKGSVLVKEFRVGGKRVETRLLMRHDDGGWGGYSYEWNDAGTDATLLPAGKTKSFGAQSWTYPDRNQCFSCHTGAAGRTLGLETGQLNADFVYTATNRVSNQLATLEHIGLFEAPIGKVADHPRFPDPFGAAPIADRARAYLHANCSGCHRPSGTGKGPQDFRYATAAASVLVCDVAPTAGDLGVAGGKLVAPGSPEKSIVSLRVHATDAKRMPPVGTRIVHAEGAALVDGWIKGTGACP
jgi:uncharacterized repeat protein (TIGR03806 family)